ncbi:MAG TPA: ABC transporter substrate-binding protein, partial [Anaerolineae bacterium]|nr:ABC transporter substrate-binding protein [Anaerolineae bacterium]
MQTKLNLLAALLLLMGVVLAACGPAAPTAPTPAPTEVSEAEPTELPEATVPSEEPTGPPQPSGEPIKIGGITSTSGFVGAFGQEQVKGGQLAVEQINDAGGLLGRPVDMIERDDKAQPAEAAKQAEDLIANEHVDMLVGCVSGANTLAIHEVANRAGVIYLSTCQTGSLNTAEGGGPYTFHMAYTPWMNTHLYGQWMAENLGDNIFFLYYDFVVGHETREGLVDALEPLGIEIAAELAVPIGTTDYTSIIPQIRAANPEVLNYFLSTDDRAAFLKQATSFGLQDEMKLMALAADLSWDQIAGFANSQGDYAPANFYWELRETLPSAKTFVDAFGEQHGTPPSGYAAYQYQAVMAYADAVREAGTVSADEVAAALEGLEFDYGSGPSFIR